MAENAAKQRVPTGLTRKQKSPYALQYLDFQRRLQGSKKCRLPTLGMRMRKHSMSDKMNCQEYLALAKQLKENREAIRFCEDKENQVEKEQAEKEQAEELKEMKNRLGQVRRYKESHSSQKGKVMSLQYSQQITPSAQQELPLGQVNCHRSRAVSSAVSNALHPLREADENASAGLKFLEYKKGRRQLPSWMKYD